MKLWLTCDLTGGASWFSCFLHAVLAEFTLQAGIGLQIDAADHVERLAHVVEVAE